MKRLTLLITILLPLLAAAQQLPQFSYKDYAGWSYNNPNVELTTENISNFRISIYVDSQGRVLTLTSPEFPCEGIDSIHATVTWKPWSLNAPGLTMALNSNDSTAVDSVSCGPTAATTSHQTLTFTLAVPDTVTTARLRFFSPQADVSTAGAIRQVTLTGITAAPHHDVVTGDVNGNGKIGIDDVTALINHLLSGNSEISLEAADVDEDGKISISDVTTLINMLLRAN